MYASNIKIPGGGLWIAKKLVELTWNDLYIIIQNSNFWIFYFVYIWTDVWQSWKNSFQGEGADRNYLPKIKL